MKIFSLIFLVVFIFVGANNVQSQVTDDPNLKACETLADEYKKLLVKVQGLENEIKLKDELIKLKDEKISFADERAAYYKKSFEDAVKIDRNSSAIIDNLRIQVNEYKQETTSLRLENTKLRESRNFRTWLGFGVGVATGYLVNK